MQFVKLVLAVAVSLSLGSIANADNLLKTVQGKPEIKSINVISFAPDGVLLVGDGAGSQIFAIRTGDESAEEGLKKKITNINAKMAGRLGAKADGIEILDIAVNPASRNIYFAVRKQDDKTHLILRVNSAGEIDELELDDVAFARIKLSAGKVVIGKITDVAWADGKVIASGRGNETFASAIFSIDAPLSHDSQGSVYSAETFHVSHGRWETKAPMSVLIPLKENGKSYVVGAFSCTPVVKYPLDSIEPGAQVKGSSVIELGSGNRPIDMFVYEKDGKPYVLANTFRFHHKKKPFGPSPYWTVKFEQGLLAEKENVNKEALRRLKGYEPATPKIEMIEAFHGVTQMDKLDNDRAVVIRETEDGLDLEPLELP